MINDTDKCYLCYGIIFQTEKVVIMIEDIEAGEKAMIDSLQIGNELINCWDDNIRKHNMRKAHQGCYDEMIEIIHKHYIRN